MAREAAFTVTYLAWMAALALLLAVLGLTLTGEQHAGLVGGVEVVVLVLGAVLFAAAGTGARSSSETSWPLLAAVSATVLTGVLAVLTSTQADAGSAVFLEVAAVVLGVLLVGAVRRG